MCRATTLYSATSLDPVQTGNAVTHRLTKCLCPERPSQLRLVHSKRTTIWLKIVRCLGPPLSSRCPAPALVSCGWRHIQHGGQGDSVNISYQIIIFKGNKTAASFALSDAEDGSSARTLGFKSLAWNAAVSSPPLLFKLCIFTQAHLSWPRRDSCNFFFSAACFWFWKIWWDFAVWKDRSTATSICNARLLLLAVCDRCVKRGGEKIKAKLWQTELQLYWW